MKKQKRNKIMEKLTLEHVNPYLPFGLKVKTELGILELNQISTDIDWYFWCNTNGDYDNKDFNFDNLSKANCSGRGFKGDEIKPILRPLSDLGKLNEAFSTEHSINNFLVEKYNVDYGIFSQHQNQLSVEIEGGPYLRYDAFKSIDFNVFTDIQNELLKNHYDIFGLIEKGLAINMNDL